MDPNKHIKEFVGVVKAIFRRGRRVQRGADKSNDEEEESQRHVDPVTSARQLSSLCHDVCHALRDNGVRYSVSDDSQTHVTSHTVTSQTVFLLSVCCLSDEP